MANIYRSDGVMISWGQAVEPVAPRFRPMNGEITDLRFKTEFVVQGETEIRTVYIDFDELYQRMVVANTSSQKAKKIRALVYEFVEKKFRTGEIPENDQRLFLSEADVEEFLGQIEVS